MSLPLEYDPGAGVVQAKRARGINDFMKRENWGVGGRVTFLSP
jgi:hypothetical protein